MHKSKHEISKEASTHRLTKNIVTGQVIQRGNRRVHAPRKGTRRGKREHMHQGRAQGEEKESTCTKEGQKGKREEKTSPPRKKTPDIVMHIAMGRLTIQHTKRRVQSPGSAPQSASASGNRKRVRMPRWRILHSYMVATLTAP